MSGLYLLVPLSRNTMFYNGRIKLWFLISSDPTANEYPL